MLTILLSACVPVEEGIDDTFLTGQVQIPPSVLVIEEEGDGRSAPLDTLSGGQEFDPGWRWQTIEGRIRTFGDPEDDENNADEDYWIFSPAATGPFTLNFSFEAGAAEGPNPPLDTGLPDTGADSADSGGDSADSADTGPAPDPVLLEVVLYDLTENQAAGYDGTPHYDADGEEIQAGLINPLAGGSSQGSEGSMVFEFGELDAGHEYVLHITGVSNETGETVTYSFETSGSDPNEASILVGAYEDASDLMNKGPLVGGSTVEGWEYDEETRTWTGSYRRMYFKSVSTEIGSNEFDTGIDIHTVNEGWNKPLYLVAGDFASLNQGLPAGTFYSSLPVEVSLKADTENETDQILIIDSIAPKVIGWEIEEEEPNDLGWDESGEAIDPVTLGAATELPMASGVGFVDVIHASLDFGELADPGDWAAVENDVFLLRSEIDTDLQITGTWPSGTNLDAVLVDVDGNMVAAGWNIADVNPEVFQPTQFDVVLTGGVDWYLVVFGWEGEAGEHPYTLELEWLGL